MQYEKAKTLKEAENDLKEGTQDYETLSVVELGATLERADISGAAWNEGEGDVSGVTIPQDKEGAVQSEMVEERTGATHLVHCWYPLGHNVSEFKYSFILSTNYLLDKNGTIC